MSKKHFIAIADAIKQHNERWGQYGDGFSTEQLDTLAVAFKLINPKFKIAKWLEYIAGVKRETK